MAAQVADSWRRHAACRQIGPDIFYEVLSEDQAKAICDQCPVREACLDFAVNEVDAGQSDKLVSGLGVWGGMSGDERVQLRKRLREQRKKEQ